MVSVHAFCAADISISVIHRLLPLLAVSICTTTHAALRLLDCYIVTVNAHVSLLVVACFLLSFGRIYISFFLRFRNFLVNCLRKCRFITIFAFRRVSRWRGCTHGLAAINFGSIGDSTFSYCGYGIY